MDFQFQIEKDGTLSECIIHTKTILCAIYSLPWPVSAAVALERVVWHSVRAEQPYGIHWQKEFLEDPEKHKSWTPQVAWHKKLVASVAMIFYCFLIL